jgi:hypothetical protein
MAEVIEESLQQESIDAGEADVAEADKPMADVVSHRAGEYCGECKRFHEAE